MGKASLEGFSIMGATGPAANYSNLLLIGAAVSLLGLVVYLACKKTIYATTADQQ